MNKKLIYSIAAISLVLFVFIAGNTSNYKQGSIKVISKDTIQSFKKVTGVVVKAYNDKQTLFVREKIDSLLERIHKRYDFHGAVLVAKKGKILYKNQIGYADFRKKKLSIYSRNKCKKC